jgi:hypothetical protein
MEDEACGGVSSICPLVLLPVWVHFTVTLVRLLAVLLFFHDILSGRVIAAWRL